MDTLRKQETLFYVVLWTGVFAVVPLVLGYNVLSGREGHFFMGELWSIWLRMLPFFLLFLFHQLLLLPILEKRKWVPYILLTLTLLVLFGIYCFTTPMRPPGLSQEPPFHPSGPPEDGLRPLKPEMLRLVLGVMVLFANVGVRAFFYARRREQELAALASQNTERQLEALRYQINPHFFMNTLNNIHALVEVDPAAAQSAIEEFSKLMRIVLYEGNAPTIPLGRELDYLRHYVSLMRLRYPESVSISLEVPDNPGSIDVPPLVMASFVENAFKHGISYEAPSFVSVHVSLLAGKVRFECSNSLHPAREQARHGLGQENARKRLELLYGSAYSLQVKEEADVYNVVMEIPG